MSSILITLGLRALGLFGGPKSSWTLERRNKIARAIGIGILSVLLLILLGVGKCAYDQSVIDDYKADRAVENQDARDRADGKAVGRETANQKSQDEIARAQAEAAAKDPEGAKKPVGPVSQSYYDNLPED